jgi:hypothetical protein
MWVLWVGFGEGLFEIYEIVPWVLRHVFVDMVICTLLLNNPELFADSAVI